MSQEQLADTKQTAALVYAALASQLGPDHWDWDPVALTAIQATESFNRVFDARYAPQSQTPPADAAAPPVAPPTEEPAPTAPPPSTEPSTPPPQTTHVQPALV